MSAWKSLRQCICEIVNNWCSERLAHAVDQDPPKVLRLVLFSDALSKVVEWARQITPLHHCKSMIPLHTLQHQHRSGTHHGSIVATRPARPSLGTISECCSATASHSVGADSNWTWGTPTAPTGTLTPESRRLNLRVSLL